MAKKKKKIYIHLKKQWVRSAPVNLSLLNFSGLGQFIEAEDLPSALSNKAVIATVIW